MAPYILWSPEARGYPPFVIYRLGFAAQFAYDRSAAFANSEMFRAEFLRKARGCLYIAVGGAIVLVAARTSLGGTDVRWDFAWVLTSVFALGFFHRYLAWRDSSTTGNRNIGGRLVEAAAWTLFVLALASPFGDLFELWRD